MSYRLACDLSDTIAAVGLVSGGYPPLECQPSRPVPVVIFHGAAGNGLAYEGHSPLLLPVREWAVAWAARITTQDINATQVIWEFFAAHPLP